MTPLKKLHCSRLQHDLLCAMKINNLTLDSHIINSDVSQVHFNGPT